MEQNESTISLTKDRISKTLIDHYAAQSVKLLEAENKLGNVAAKTGFYYLNESDVGYSVKDQFKRFTDAMNVAHDAAVEIMSITWKAYHAHNANNKGGNQL